MVSILLPFAPILAITSADGAVLGACFALAIATILLTMVARGKVETVVHLSDYVEGDDVPLIDGDEEDGEKIHSARFVLLAPRPDQLQAVTMTRAPVNCGLHLHAQGARGVVDSHVVACYSEGSRDLHPVARRQHHEVEFCPLSTGFGVL